LRGFQAGIRSEDVAKQINQVLGGENKRRAQIIARDQISKLNGQLNELRQTELGLTQFRWRTVGDDRVRPSHAALDTKTFSWNDPPIVDGEPTVPGQAINCRCIAEPLFEDIYKDLGLE
jgi:SPP1 gp7 family putative phage head morphogenesis protein